MKDLTSQRSEWVVSAAIVLVVSTFFTLLAPDVRSQSRPNADGWVVLPVDDYRSLWKAAYPVAADPAPPPVEATLTRVDYELRIEGDLASGDARLTVDIIKEGWVRVPIPTGLMVRQARIDGRPVSLVTEASSKGTNSYVLLSKSGRTVLTLSVVSSVSAVAGTEILKLPISSAAISRASVVIPRQGFDVRITGGLLLSKSETSDGTVWVANGRGAEMLTFAWRRKIDDQRSAQAVRIRGDLTELVSLGEDNTQVTAEVKMDVLAGSAKEVRLQLPEQLTVNQVAGAMIADWEAKNGELLVSFLEPVSQSSRFTVSGEIRLPRDGQIGIPVVRIPSSERETGGLAVEVLGAGEIKERKSQGLEESEAAYLGPLISSRQSPSLAAFRYASGGGLSERSLSLTVARYTPQAVLNANVEEAAYNALITEDGKTLVQARFAVRNNQRNFLKISLPAGASLWSLVVAGRPLRPGLGPDGSLLVPLEKSRTADESPAFAVEVSYLDHGSAWGEKGKMKLSLLTLDMAISKSRLLIHYSPTYRLTAMPGGFRTAEYSPVAKNELRRRFDVDDFSREAWRSLAEEPLGSAVERYLKNDLVRGLVFTDAKIGILTYPHDPSLVQNRCFLYHVIGNRTGEWRVPVGGMGTVARAIEDAARDAGTEILTNVDVRALHLNGTTQSVDFWIDDRRQTVDAEFLLVNFGRNVLAKFTDKSYLPNRTDEGSVFKINMLLRRLPKLKSKRSPTEAFTGTFHSDEGYEQMQRSYEQAARGELPEKMPCEIYCHTLTDATILSPELRRKGYQTLTLFGLDAPYSLFQKDNERMRQRAERKFIDSINQWLEEPLEDCLARASDGSLCIESKSPVDIEEALGMYHGNIFQDAPTFPFTDENERVGTWGVETEFENVFLCGSSALRGGAVSGIPGHNAAMKVFAVRKSVREPFTVAAA